MSIFSLTRKNFDVNDYHGDPIKKYEYRTGRRNTFTGKRPIYVIEKEEASGGPLLVTAIISIIIGFTGIFKFILEAVRVMLSDQRQAEWEGCREFLIEKINEEGKIKFFNVPIIVLGVFLISWVICIGASTVDKIIYDPGNINIEINEKINRAYGKQITSKQVYQILQFFDKMYYELTDLEKKEFFQDFIESIELYPERMEDGRIVKQINFEFPVFYKGVESMAIRLPNEKTVETVCLLSKLHEVKRYVNVNLSRY